MTSRITLRSRKEEDKRDGEPDEFTPEMVAKQKAQYKNIFDVFRQHKDRLNAVTSWNVSGKRSWLNNFPFVEGRVIHRCLTRN